METYGPSWDQYRLYLENKLRDMSVTLENLDSKIDKLIVAQATAQAVSQEKARWTGALWGGAVAVGAILAKAFWAFVFGPHK